MEEPDQGPSPCANKEACALALDKSKDASGHKSTVCPNCNYVINPPGSKQKSGAPKKRIQPPWWNDEVEEAIEKKRKALKVSNRTGRASDLLTYKRANAFARYTVRNAKAKYQETLEKISKITNKNLSTNGDKDNKEGDTLTNEEEQLEEEHLEDEQPGEDGDEEEDCKDIADETVDGEPSTDVKNEDNQETQQDDNIVVGEVKPANVDEQI